MSRWKLEAIVKDSEWDAGDRRFALPRTLKSDRTQSYEYSLWLPEDCFDEFKVRRLGPEFVEGWYRHVNSCNPLYYLTREPPDAVTRKDTERNLKAHQQWIYRYTMVTAEGAPPRLTHQGGLDWDSNHQHYEKV